MVQQNIFAGKNLPTDAGNQVVAQAALSDPAEYDFRVAQPNLGSTNYAAFSYASPAGTVSRGDFYYGALVPDRPFSK